MAVNLVLERLAGIDYTVTERATGSKVDGVFTVRDFLPSNWDRAAVAIPYLGTTVLIERIGPKSKRIIVTGNPLGALRVQPSLDGGRFVSAIPDGYVVSKSGNRVEWCFVGEMASSVTATVVWD